MNKRKKVVSKSKKVIAKKTTSKDKKELPTKWLKINEHRIVGYPLVGEDEDYFYFTMDRRGSKKLPFYDTYEEAKASKDVGNIESKTFNYT